MVTIAASAATIEALYEDVRYLVPEQRKRSPAAKSMAYVISLAFGLNNKERTHLIGRLIALFDARNTTLHGYSGFEPPDRHPSGILTGAEFGRFNSMKSREAVVLALHVLEHAEKPRGSFNRWVARWVVDRATYHESVVRPIRKRY